jgi:hypothetical protein
MAGEARKAGIIMRAILEHAARNSCYGQWPLALPEEQGSKTGFHCP